MLTKRTHREMIQVGIRQEVMITGVAQVIMKHKRSDSIYTRQGVTIAVSITSSFIMCGIIAVIYFSVNPGTVFSLCQNQAIYLDTCWNMQV